MSGTGTGLRLERKVLTPESTIGELSLDGVFQCWTLEDAVREGEKVFGKTAIHYGLYRVIVTHSERFKRDMPLLLDVPGFEGVRIHCGNTAADSDGCILLGRVKGKDWIGESRKAFDELFPKIRARTQTGELWLEIV